MRQALEEAVRHKVSLARAALAGEDLHNAVLDRAQLGGADLIAADLGGASLEGTDLRSADLTGAVIWGSSIAWAKLTGATLPSGDTWPGYLSTVRELLEAGTAPLRKVLIALHWRDNFYSPLGPLARVFGVQTIDQVPAEWRERARTFYELFALGLVTRRRVLAALA
jgi:hypothetical protein